MFITKLLIAFAGVVPLAPTAADAPISSASTVVEAYSEVSPDLQHCYDVDVEYDGITVNVSACGNTAQQALNKLGAAVRRLADAQQ